MITLYGLKNCDSCAKARKWLAANDVEHSFHDVRADGLTRQQIEGWVGELGWETVLNRRSTTWRGLLAQDKDGLDDGRAVALMVDHPTLIKRPVIETAAATLIGFTEETQKALNDLAQ